MAHRHYETEGLIINHRNLGEANRRYQILTLDFGLIDALAQSVRRDRSKLRYYLKDFSFVQLTLVRGREFWRIVGVNHLNQSSQSSPEAIIFLKKISLVLQRLIHGEESNPLIFQDLKQAWHLISTHHQQSAEALINLEIFILTRLLIQLGYLAPPVEFKELLSTPVFAWAEIKKIDQRQSSLIKQINRALAVTQL